LSGSSIEARFLAFLRDRVTTMGADLSGAHGYYTYRLKRDQGLMEYERVLIDWILARRPVRVVHAGIGMGPLIAALAEGGVEAVGYEGSRLRFAAARALRAALGLSYELRRAHYPDGDVGRGGLLLFTNVASGWTRRRVDAILATFTCFDEVILDLRLFGETRERAAERDALRRRLAAIGPVEDLPPIPGAFYVRLSPLAS
jgi:hypothetical protein